MFLSVHTVVSIYASIFFTGRQNECFHIIQRKVEFMLLHAHPAGMIYANIFVSER